MEQHDFMFQFLFAMRQQKSLQRFNFLIPYRPHGATGVCKLFFLKLHVSCFHTTFYFLVCFRYVSLPLMLTDTCKYVKRIKMSTNCILYTYYTEIKYDNLLSLPKLFYHVCCGYDHFSSLFLF